MPKPWELTDDELAEGTSLDDDASQNYDALDEELSLSGDLGSDPWGDEGDDPDPEAAPTAGVSPAKVDAAPAPQLEPELEPAVDSDGSFEDLDDPDMWDAVVPAPEAPGTGGYQVVPVAPQAPTVGHQGEPSPEAELDVEDEDDSITVTLRRLKPENKPAPPTPREYRTKAESRRPHEAPRRRERLSSNARPPTLMERVKGAFDRGEEKEVAERAVKRAAASPVNVAVIGGKGGVGKTTLTVLLGMAFASVRGDRVLGVDASPSGGNLSSRGPREGRGTVTSLLGQLDYVSSYANVRQHTSQGPTGLELLGADRVKPERRFTGQDYQRLLDEFRRHYTVILSDTPGSIMDMSPEMVTVVFDEADVLVLAVEGVDGMDSAVRAINDLKALIRETDDQHLEKLLSDLVVVVTSRASRTSVAVSNVAKFFEQVADQVVTVPFDPVLEGGVEIDFDRISVRTHKAVMKLAAAVASSDGFTGR